MIISSLCGKCLDLGIFVYFIPMHLSGHGETEDENSKMWAISVLFK